MERPVVENKIADSLNSKSRGRILFVIDFLDLGNLESVKRSLSRLTEKNILVRLAHGVYLYPRTDKELGTILPSTEEIALAIARRDRARIVPTGIHALNKLGLSTQVPMKVVYLTDGSARTIKVGKRTITFKRTSPKNLQAKGEVSSLVIQTLKTLGQKGTDESIINKLNIALRSETPSHIQHDAKLAPAWIRRILLASLK